MAQPAGVATPATPDTGAPRSRNAWVRNHIAPGSPGERVSTARKDPTLAARGPERGDALLKEDPHETGANKVLRAGAGSPDRRDRGRGLIAPRQDGCLWKPPV